MTGKDHKVINGKLFALVDELLHSDHVSPFCIFECLAEHTERSKQALNGSGHSWDNLTEVEKIIRNETAKNMTEAKQKKGMIDN